MFGLNKKNKDDELVLTTVYDIVTSEKVEDAVKNDKDEKVETPVEEWIWVEGYKGTNRDMTCRDFQFELGKQYDMPEDAVIEDCACGFHLCLKLNHVFKYYDIEDGHRFFRVRALVRKADVEEYGVYKRNVSCDYGSLLWSNRVIRDKLAAKSIEFIDECSLDEIFEVTSWDVVSSWSNEDKKLAIDIGIKKVDYNRKTRILTELGYSLPFADYIIENGKYEVAFAVGHQEDLSMDMKALMILKA